jgi:hypothetical protein
MFNLAIIASCAAAMVVSLKLEDCSDRATVRQKKTGQPVRFELTKQTRRAVQLDPTTSQAPAATKPIPAMREIRRPTGTIFSMSTKA